MSDQEYKTLLKNSTRSKKELPIELREKAEQVEEVIKKYPMRVNPYYLSLIKEKDDGIWKQCIPDIREITDTRGKEDPLHEEIDSPVPGLTHRYPDRVLLLVSNKCAMYCRFCTRKRKVGKRYETMTRGDFKNAMKYIKEHKEIRDVILSGGDPLMLSDSKLEYFIKEVRKVDHVEIIRIGTRVPCTLPMRVTKKLCNMLKKYHPLYINVHFEHPAEITPASAKACEMLANAGIPLGNQTVLLKGVNDDPKVMKELVQKLLKIRVKPYYLYLPDTTKGTAHFRPSIESALKVIDSIRGWTSGMAVPHLIVDIEGGGGKIPFLPDYLLAKEGKKYIFRNYKGDLFEYEDI